MFGGAAAAFKWKVYSLPAELEGATCVLPEMSCAELTPVPSAMIADTVMGAAPPSGKARANGVESAATAIEGGWLSKYTCCTALVDWRAVGLDALMVKSSGAVPSKLPEGRGNENVNVLLVPAVPGCAHAAVSPVTVRQTVAGSTPARPVIDADTARDPPVVSKNARPLEFVKPGGVETAMSEKDGASVATHTRAARSQAAPAEQSPSLEQVPSSEVRQAKSEAERTTTRVARMVRRRR